ncbi:MAG: hypothetical protein VX277_01755 [Candidatus Thermoplasmatota archaeon]|nr:hypothetical protein [Candidatus Thermoplasmatota archaeon]CAI8234280.1 MAG: Uncharacterised protein [Euryarchaeota archaeon]
MRDNLTQSSERILEEGVSGWVRRKMNWKQAFQTGLVLGIAGFVFTFILHLYYIALDPDLILRGFKVAFASSIFLTIAGSLIFKLVGKKVWEGHQGVAPLDVLRTVLSPIEQKATNLLWSPIRTWKISTHVRSEGIGTTVDLHDLDIKMGKAVVEVLIAVRNKIGRIRLVTGRGKNSPEGAKMRPAILEMLRQRQGEHNWNMQIGQGSVTLRPKKNQLSNRVMFFKFILFSIPLCIGGYFGFSAIGNGDEISQVVGFVSGAFLAAILASYNN